MNTKNKQNGHGIKLSFDIVRLQRKTPLRISRGTSGDTVNVWVRIEYQGREGWGAACPFSTGAHTETVGDITGALEQGFNILAPCGALERQRIGDRLRSELNDPSFAAMAALDTALLDWLGKKVDLPLWRLWGLDISAVPPTSVTVGMEDADSAKQIATQWLQGDGLPGRTEGQKNFSVLKVKLGDPQGIGADKARVDAVIDVAGGANVIVDANAGWDLKEAFEMCGWLETRGVDLVEQPLAVDAASEWRRLHDHTALKLFADESCFRAADAASLADCIDGVVIKLMKCGGLSRALELVHTARACGLDVMLGCYADTVLSNSAMAQIAPLVDYVDLDSHLNLKNDPFLGADLRDGRLIPNNLPGIGVRLREN